MKSENKKYLLNQYHQVRPIKLSTKTLYVDMYNLNLLVYVLVIVLSLRLLYHRRVWKVFGLKPVAPLPLEVNDTIDGIHRRGTRLSAGGNTSGKNECVTWLVFMVLVVLVVLNIALYYKLWMLEEAPPHTQLDMQLLNVPPKSHEEWLKLLQQQEKTHTTEMRKWQRILKHAVQLLRKTEESLSELQHSVDPKTSEFVSVLQAQKDGKKHC